MSAILMKVTLAFMNDQTGLRDFPTIRDGFHHWLWISVQFRVPNKHDPLKV